MQWHWELLIIPLIALGVWILSTLFKGGEDDRLKKGVRRATGSAGRTPSRRPVTDLDRFLEEARQRREAEERLQTPAPISVRPTVSRPPLRERSAPPRETPPSRPAAPPVRKVDAPLATPVARPVTRPARAEPVLVEPPVVEAAPVPPAAPVTTRDIRPSPIMQHLRALLNKPQSARTAFALREIFGPPLCRRRR